MTSEQIEHIVRRNYQPMTAAEASHVESAQLWREQWWVPLWGCDTLDHLLDDLRPPAALDEDRPSTEPESSTGEHIWRLCVQSAAWQRRWEWTHCHHAEQAWWELEATEE